MILFSIFALSHAASASDLNFTSGSGTPDDPFIIASVSDLVNFSTLVNSGHLIPDTDLKYAGADYSLSEDLDLFEAGVYQWTPAGKTILSAFFGNFSGNDHVLSNICVSPDYIQSGFIGSLKSGSVADLNLKNVSITGTGDTGGLIGKINAYGNVSVSECSVSGIISSSGCNTGGICGDLYVYNSNLTVKLSSVSFFGIVDGSYCTGGISGEISPGASNDHILIENAVSAAEIFGTSNTGGITGRIAMKSGSDAILNYVFSYGNVCGGENTAGIAGEVTAASHGTGYAQISNSGAFERSITVLSGTLTPPQRIVSVQISGVSLQNNYAWDCIDNGTADLNISSDSSGKTGASVPKEMIWLNADSFSGSIFGSSLNLDTAVWKRSSSAVFSLPVINSSASAEYDASYLSWSYDPAPVPETQKEAPHAETQSLDTSNRDTDVSANYDLKSGETKRVQLKKGITDSLEYTVKESGTSVMFTLKSSRRISDADAPDSLAYPKILEYEYLELYRDGFDSLSDVKLRYSVSHSDLNVNSKTGTTTGSIVLLHYIPDADKWFEIDSVVIEDNGGRIQYESVLEDEGRYAVAVKSAPASDNILEDTVFEIGVSDAEDRAALTEDSVSIETVLSGSETNEDMSGTVLLCAAFLSVTASISAAYVLKRRKEYPDWWFEK